MLPVEPPLEPMLARTATDIPVGGEWRYEPKWDGFRALIFRDGEDTRIISRKNTTLNRYFPELIDVFQVGLPSRSVIDGEIVYAGPRGLEFETLQLRLHPAASRVAKLSKEIPAAFVAFDILAHDDRDLRPMPLLERRRELSHSVAAVPSLSLTPQTADPDEARTWFTRFEGAGLDGVIAKCAGDPYIAGKREWIKIKHQRTVDCVVGGYRLSSNGTGLGSLLLGLYSDDGVLHHVGHTSSFNARERRELLERLKPYEHGESFGSGRTPGGPSRWSQGRDLNWVSLAPELVCEVGFEKLEGDRFRHAARFLRWREDKPPRACTYDQLQPPEHFDLAEIVELGRASNQTS
ncbi:MAG TPA: ATP-dependent DNA ligase [Chloroflexota bacterium]|nr:ATP-dependent DNA ligase [Chloroflexota bacterium]